VASALPITTVTPVAVAVVAADRVADEPSEATAVICEPAAIPAPDTSLPMSASVKSAAAEPRVVLVLVTPSVTEREPTCSRWASQSRPSVRNAPSSPPIAHEPTLAPDTVLGTTVPFMLTPTCNVAARLMSEAGVKTCVYGSDPDVLTAPSMCLNRVVAPITDSSNGVDPPTSFSPPFVAPIRFTRAPARRPSDSMMGSVRSSDSPSRIGRNRSGVTVVPTVVSVLNPNWVIRTPWGQRRATRVGGRPWALRCWPTSWLLP